jgi:hypothetical protein
MINQYKKLKLGVNVFKNNIVFDLKRITEQNEEISIQEITTLNYIGIVCLLDHLEQYHDEYISKALQGIAQNPLIDLNTIRALIAMKDKRINFFLTFNPGFQWMKYMGHRLS